MIERKSVAENLKELQIEEYLRSIIGKAGISYIKLQRTPLGEKIVVCAMRPGLIVGKSGSNINRLTKDLKDRFALENPQLELVEAETPMLDANIVAESIANSLERFGTARFKGVGHKAMSDIMAAGARGVEIVISGKIPSSRAKSWRFYAGYLKKSGDIAVSGVRKAYTTAKLKTGVVGVQVRIMPASTKLPDDVTYLAEGTVIAQPVMHVKEEKRKTPKKKESTDRKSDRSDKTDNKSADAKPKRSPKKDGAKKSVEKKADKSADKPVVEESEKSAESTESKE